MRYRTSIFIALLIPFTLLGTAYLQRGRDLSPEQRIIGNWNEVSWTYAKADNSEFLPLNGKTIDESAQQLIARSRIIHKAECWKFTRDSGLYLNANQKHQELRWSILGSSNTLKISYKDEFTESYDLVELTDKRMILHFENDLLARGIVRIVFEKT